jgi:hypothetical protein
LNTPVVQAHLCSEQSASDCSVQPSAEAGSVMTEEASPRAQEAAVEAVQMVTDVTTQATSERHLCSLDERCLPKDAVSSLQQLEGKVEATLHGLNAVAHQLESLETSFGDRLAGAEAASHVKAARASSALDLLCHRLTTLEESVADQQAAADAGTAQMSTALNSLGCRLVYVEASKEDRFAAAKAHSQAAAGEAVHAPAVLGKHAEWLEVQLEEANTQVAEARMQVAACCLQLDRIQASVARLDGSRPSGTYQQAPRSLSQQRLTPSDHDHPSTLLTGSDCDSQHASDASMTSGKASGYAAQFMEDRSAGWGVPAEVATGGPAAVQPTDAMDSGSSSDAVASVHGSSYDAHQPFAACGLGTVDDESLDADESLECQVLDASCTSMAQFSLDLVDCLECARPVCPGAQLHSDLPYTPYEVLAVPGSHTSATSKTSSRQRTPDEGVLPSSEAALQRSFSGKLTGLDAVQNLFSGQAVMPPPGMSSCSEQSLSCSASYRQKDMIGAGNDLGRSTPTELEADPSGRLLEHLQLASMVTELQPRQSMDAKAETRAGQAHGPSEAGWVAAGQERPTQQPGILTSEPRGLSAATVVLVSDAGQLEARHPVRDTPKMETDDVLKLKQHKPLVQDMHTASPGSQACLSYPQDHSTSAQAVDNTCLHMSRLELPVTSIERQHTGVLDATAELAVTQTRLVAEQQRCLSRAELGAEPFISSSLPGQPGTCVQGLQDQSSSSFKADTLQSVRKGGAIVSPENAMQKAFSNSCELSQQLEAIEKYCDRIAMQQAASTSGFQARLRALEQLYVPPTEAALSQQQWQPSVSTQLDNGMVEPDTMDPTIAPAYATPAPHGAPQIPTQLDSTPATSTSSPCLATPHLAEQLVCSQAGRALDGPEPETESCPLDAEEEAVEQALEAIVLEVFEEFNMAAPEHQRLEAFKKMAAEVPEVNSIAEHEDSVAWPTAAVTPTSMEVNGLQQAIPAAQASISPDSAPPQQSAQTVTSGPEKYTVRSGCQSDRRCDCQPPGNLEELFSLDRTGSIDIRSSHGFLGGGELGTRKPRLTTSEQQDWRAPVSWIAQQRTTATTAWCDRLIAVQLQVGASKSEQQLGLMAAWGQAAIAQSAWEAELAAVQKVAVGAQTKLQAELDKTLGRAQISIGNMKMELTAVHQQLERVLQAVAAHDVCRAELGTVLEQTGAAQNEWRTVLAAVQNQLDVVLQTAVSRDEWAAERALAEELVSATQNHWRSELDTIQEQLESLRGERQLSERRSKADLLKEDSFKLIDWQPVVAELQEGLAAVQEGDCSALGLQQAELAVVEGGMTLMQRALGVKAKHIGVNGSQVVAKHAQSQRQADETVLQAQLATAVGAQAQERGIMSADIEALHSSAACVTAHDKYLHHLSAVEVPRLASGDSGNVAGIGDRKFWSSPGQAAVVIGTTTPQLVAANGEISVHQHPASGVRLLSRWAALNLISPVKVVPVLDQKQAPLQEPSLRKLYGIALPKADTVAQSMELSTVHFIMSGRRCDAQAPYAQALLQVPSEAGPYESHSSSHARQEDDAGTMERLPTGRSFSASAAGQPDSVSSVGSSSYWRSWSSRARSPTWSDGCWTSVCSGVGSGSLGEIVRSGEVLESIAASIAVLRSDFESVESRVSAIEADLQAGVLPSATAGLGECTVLGGRQTPLPISGRVPLGAVGTTSEQPCSSVKAVEVGEQVTDQLPSISAYAAEAGWVPDTRPAGTAKVASAACSESPDETPANPPHANNNSAKTICAPGCTPVLSELPQTVADSSSTGGASASRRHHSVDVGLEALLSGLLPRMRAPVALRPQHTTVQDALLAVEEEGGLRRYRVAVSLDGVCSATTAAAVQLAVLGSACTTRQMLGGLEGDVVVAEVQSESIGRVTGAALLLHLRAAHAYRLPACSVVDCMSNEASRNFFWLGFVAS